MKMVFSKEISDYPDYLTDESRISASGDFPVEFAWKGNGD